MKVLSLAIAAVAATSSQAICKSVPSGSDMQEPNLEFSIVGSAETGEGAEPSITSASAEEVALTGVISTPNPCYDIKAALSRDGRALTLTLTATARPEICIQVVAAFTYDARLTDLEPGSYTLTVAYEYPGIGWESSEHTLQLEVP